MFRSLKGEKLQWNR